MNKSCPSMYSIYTGSVIQHSNLQFHHSVPKSSKNTFRQEIQKSSLIFSIFFAANLSEKGIWLTARKLLLFLSVLVIQDRLHTPRNCLTLTTLTNTGQDGLFLPQHWLIIQENPKLMLSL